MPRKKKTDPSGKHGPLPARPAPVPAPQPAEPPLSPIAPHLPAAAPGTTASSALARLVYAADGRYSVNAHADGTAYHKWRWSLGPYAGRYVMFVASRWQGIDEGFFGLLAKIDAVYEGRLIATLDRYGAD